MEQWFLYGGMALCLFSLWAILRHDWIRITTQGRRVDATVTGHRTITDGDGTSYAATYRFSAEGSDHEVVDQVSQTIRTPPEGTRVVLSYPVGRPDLARVPRPLLWIGIYVFFLGLFGLLLAKALGLIGS